MPKKTFFLIAVIILLVMLHLILRQRLSEIVSDTGKLKKELEATVAENRFLGAAVSQNEALPRIEKIATEKLGMVKPKNIYYLQFPTEEAEVSLEAVD